MPSRFSLPMVMTPLTDALLDRMRAGKPVSVEEAIDLARRLERGLRRIEIINLGMPGRNARQDRTLTVVAQTLEAISSAPKVAQTSTPESTQPPNADLYAYPGKEARAQ